LSGKGMIHHAFQAGPLPPRDSAPHKNLRLLRAEEAARRSGENTRPKNPGNGLAVRLRTRLPNRKRGPSYFGRKGFLKSWRTRRDSHPSTLPADNGALIAIELRIQKMFFAPSRAEPVASPTGMAMRARLRCAMARQASLSLRFERRFGGMCWVTLQFRLFQFYLTDNRLQVGQTGSPPNELIGFLVDSLMA